MLKSFFALVDDVATIAVAPARVAVDVARTVTKPLADAAKEAADAVSGGLSEDEKRPR